VVDDGDAADAAFGRFEAEPHRAAGNGLLTALPGSADAMGALRDMGVKIALITGFSASIRAALLASLGWQDLVDIALSPSAGVRGRPAPDLVLSAVMQLGPSSVRCVAVAGDTATTFTRERTQAPASGGRPHRCAHP
jgi:beta-phosphoglucomutase-like phosphatase (HAD superfamily)